MKWRFGFMYVLLLYRIYSALMVLQDMDLKGILESPLQKYLLGSGREKCVGLVDDAILE